MEARYKRILWFGVSTAIIAGMLYFANFNRVLDSLRMMELIYTVPAFVFGLSVFGVWSYTWYSFFQRMDLDISFYQSFKMFMAGNFLNSITPLGQFGGEPLMAYIISDNTESNFEKAFSTVFSADIINTVPIFTFVLGGAAYMLVFSTSVNHLVLQTVYMALLATVVGGIIVYLLWFRAGFIESRLVTFSQKAASLIGRGDSIVSRIEKSMERLEKSFETVGEDPKHLFKVGIIAHIGFVFQLFCLYFLLLAVGVESDFTPLYFVLALSSLANFTPTPGGSGTFEAAMAGFLTFFVTIDFASALTVAIIFRLTTYWPGLLIGYLSLNTLERNGR